MSYKSDCIHNVLDESNSFSKNDLNKCGNPFCKGYFVALKR